MISDVTQEIFDANADNQISVEEFVCMVKKMGLFKGRDDLECNDEETENIKCAFIALGGSADYSGVVSCARLKTMVEIFDLDLDVDALLRLLDDDQGGMVSYSEFAELFATRLQRKSLIKEIIEG